MFRNLKIGQKFSLTLIVIFTISFLVTGGAFIAILNRNAEGQIASKAVILLRTMISVRNYTSQQVRPELADRLQTEAEFIPQTVPAYSAREVFEDLRSDPDYSEFFYKEATLNPTNLRDKADRFEADIVERFRQASGLDELRGYRSTPSGELFYIARPISISKESCLECHGVPSDAPASQLATYGRENGFGWQLNEVVGAQIISVPASGVFLNARQALLILMGIVAIAFTVSILLTNIFLQQVVIRPLMKMARVADEISKGKMDSEFAQTSKDEVGILAAAFNRMRASLVVAMKMLDRQND
ncbi:DUF3365 domain-containing protein [Synechococcus sp. PCC 7336]|uniref:c-type heme family protein n=1 Tax=Synechococcus sp. PCC 7336 TaxID=195250 RepID=UPI00034A0634|nr:DUF3365 domain-containing protein [Synechococcus sp. PCC 7336]